MCYVCKSGRFPKVADLKVWNWWFCKNISGKSRCSGCSEGHPELLIESRFVNGTCLPVGKV